MTPTARSLKYLREHGWTACVVEKWIPASKAGFKGRIIRKDAFEWGDILAVNEKRARGAVLVQTTTMAHAATRVTKAKGNAALRVWLNCGNVLIVHAWRKLKGRWTVEEREVRIADL